MSNNMQIYEDSKKYKPGGVHTSIRNVDPMLVFTKAEGAYIYDDANGKKYRLPGSIRSVHRSLCDAWTHSK
jgi:glutamate-1-semialdehyde 2,1-aminomutase